MIISCTFYIQSLSEILTWVVGARKARGRGGGRNHTRARDASGKNAKHEGRKREEAVKGKK